MRHDDRGDAARLDVLHDSMLGHGVQRRGRLVQDQHLRISDQGARDRDALALTAGEVLSAGADQIVVAARMRQDILFDAGLPGSPGDLRTGDPAVPEADVVARGRLKERAFLAHDRHTVSKEGFRQLEAVHPVIQHLPRPGEHRAGHELCDGGFARAGRPHEGHALARLDFEGEIIQQRRAQMRIAEGDVPKLDASLQGGKRCVRFHGAEREGLVLLIAPYVLHLLDGACKLPGVPADLRQLLGRGRQLLDQGLQHEDEAYGGPAVDDGPGGHGQHQGVCQIQQENREPGQIDRDVVFPGFALVDLRLLAGPAGEIPVGHARGLDGLDHVDARDHDGVHAHLAVHALLLRLKREAGQEPGREDIDAERKAPQEGRMEVQGQERREIDHHHHKLDRRRRDPAHQKLGNGGIHREP